MFYAKEILIVDEVQCIRDSLILTCHYSEDVFVVSRHLFTKGRNPLSAVQSGALRVLIYQRLHNIHTNLIGGGESSSKAGPALETLHGTNRFQHVFLRARSRFFLAVAFVWKDDYEIILFVVLMSEINIV